MGYHSLPSISLRISAGDQAVPIRRCLVAITICLVGCVATGTQQVQSGKASLNAHVQVLDKLADLSYRPLKPTEAVKFELNDRSQVIEESGVKRYALGFVLPAGVRPLALRIASWQLGTPQDRAILYPEVRLLDANFKSLQVMPSNSFVYRTSTQRSELAAVFFLNEPMGDERYVLVTSRALSDADLLVSQSNITGSTAVALPGGGVWFVPTGSNSAPVKMIASPTGKLEIKIDKYQLRKVGQ